MKQIYLITTLFLSINMFAQIANLTEKYTMDTSVQETSGLIFHNGKLITHNDSGGTAQLFEMDTISNTITRTITISNATNIDWEDIAQDNDYIYIGDFGNNNGTRTDLKIYRVPKSEYDANTTVAAEVINFSYDDQTTFTSDSDTNFDAEAMIVKGDNILIFSKNHGDYQCNLYILPKTIGTHTAVNSSTYNVSGMITGADYNAASEQIFLTGYQVTSATSGTPFITYLADYTGDTVFGGTVTRTDILDAGSQVEAIAFASNERLFISREHVSTTYGGTTYDFPQKLYGFNSEYTTAAVGEQKLTNVAIYPNPAKTNFTIKLNNPNSGTYKIINQLGQVIQNANFENSHTIPVSITKKGMYFVVITIQDGVETTQKVVIN